MRDCVIVLPYGRNVSGVFNDAIVWLAEHDYAPVKTYLVAKEGETSPCGETITVNRRGQSQGLYPDGLFEGLPLVFVMTGGTTPQAWFLFRLWGRLIADDRSPPCLVLDVQPDGVEVLGSLFWAD